MADRGGRGSLHRLFKASKHKMEIVHGPDGRFTIPCREWASVHMDLNLTYKYKTRRNAERAALDPKRNQTTRLCHYAEQLYSRVCVLETILLRIKQQTNRYDFGPDVIGPEFDGRSTDGERAGASGDDTRSGDAATVSAGADAAAG